MKTWSYRNLPITVLAAFALILAATCTRTCTTTASWARCYVRRGFPPSNWRRR